MGNDEVPTLKSSSKKDRDIYRKEMNEYNARQKEKEKEFNDEYKKQILNKTEEQMLKNGYFKDKNGKWTKPTTIDDVPLLAKAFDSIGLKKWANDTISVGENLYNKPSVNNLVKAVTVMKDSANMVPNAVEKNLKKVEQVKDVVNKVQSVRGKGRVKITREKDLLLLLI
jgi:hypothetical protein